MYPNISKLSTEPALGFYNEYVESQVRGYTARYFGKVCSQYIEKLNEKHIDGIMEIDRNNNVLSVEEKPKNPRFLICFSSLPPHVVTLTKD